MKKMMKKVFAGAMAAAVAIGGVAASPVSVKAADSYEAFLMFTDNNWGYSNWDSSLASTTVTGDGTYTVTLNASDVNDESETGYTATTGVLVFCVDIVGINLDDDGTTILENTTTLDDISISMDGTEVDVDTSCLITGDIEENGNFRIEIRNEYGDTKSAPAIDENLSWSETLSVTFTISNTGMESSDAEETSEATTEEESEAAAEESTDDAAADDTTATDAASTDDSNTDDSSTTTTTTTTTTSDSDDSTTTTSTQTGDAAPIAAVAVALAGCALVYVAAKKRMA